MAIPQVVSADARRQIDRVKAEHGWTMPFYSSHRMSFSDDYGAGVGFLLNAFLRDGGQHGVGETPVAQAGTVVLQLV